MEIVIPPHFRCPISLDLMRDPVTLPTGITYDRDSIEKWNEAGNLTCPVTNMVLSSGFDQIPNHAIRKMIQNWCVENRSYGVERIPTPRIPVTSYQVSDTCKRIAIATQRMHGNKCLELMGKFKQWGKESERNKRCIRDNGAAARLVLSGCFESFSSVSADKHVELLSEILSVLTWMFPLCAESQTKLGSAGSLRSLVWLLKSGDLSTRRSAVLVLKELLADRDQSSKQVGALADIEGAFQALIKLIKEPICPTATKAALMSIFYMISPTYGNEMIMDTFVQMGLVSLVSEILVDADKSTCEKALAVLDRTCQSNKGIEQAYQNDLIVPVLIKKILRISNLASDFCVSILWKLCKKESNDTGVVVEALHFGAFQKLLLLLQVGCGGNTKEKVTDLLKLLNHHTVRLNCVDASLDFRYLKRSL